MPQVTGIWVISSSSPSRHSIVSMVIAITSSDTRSASTPTAPLPNTSARASTSLVRRVSSLPTGVRSWKRSDSSIAWRNRSSRMRAVRRWPTTCTLKLWVPCRPSRSTTAASSRPTSSRSAWVVGRPFSQGSTEGSLRSTEIAWPTSTGWMAPARARGMSSSRESSSRRRSRPR